MKSISFDYENTAQINETDLQHLFTQLAPAIDHLTNARTLEYKNDYASINLAFDEEYINHVCATVKEKKSLNPTTLVVIGIGGSNLGTIAILQALRGNFYNEHGEIAVYFVDTVDSDNISDIAQLVERELETGNNIIINVISKSGTTTETIANFEIFLEILKSHRPYNYHQFIVTTTDNDSALWKLEEI
jgi:glucose-6-phosphate isomerase